MAAQEAQPEASSDTITAFMSADHARIHKIWEETLTTLHAEDFNQLHERAGKFIAAFRRHISTEEQILFPAIEQRTGARDSGPTYAMRLEHREIERVLDGLKRLLTVEELWTGIQAVEGEPYDPTALFRSHESKEHDVLYPHADKVVGADEARKLIERMRTEVDKG
ncbi:MAG TPA: hemerythrin domain-containing protein [Candidatus Binataceae bacterium]|nr:hemerythrin domain-containing protein [Candidatus Binataceae bacterium]